MAVGAAPSPPNEPVADNPWAAPTPAGAGWFGDPFPPPKASKTVRTAIAFAVLGAVVVSLGVVAALAGDPHQADHGSAAENAPGPFVVATAGPVTATSPVSLNDGAVVFSDDFDDPTSGWTFHDNATARTAYTKHGFRLTLLKDYADVWPSPYQPVWPQISQTVVATTSAASPAEMTVGPGCERDWDKPDEIDYDFDVDRDGGWEIDRVSGLTTSADPFTEVAEGAVVVQRGNPVVLNAVCASLPGGRRTRLLLFVNGTEAADVTDVTPSSASGWGGMLVTGGGDDKPGTAYVTHYAESRLGAQ